MNKKSLTTGLMILLSTFNVCAKPGEIYILTGEEKSILEIVKADMEHFPELYLDESIESYTKKFKTENRIGKRKLSPKDELQFPATQLSIKYSKFKNECQLVNEHRRSVYIDMHHCAGITYKENKQAWDDAGFNIQEGQEPLMTATLNKYDVLVLDQPWPDRKQPFSSEDIRAVTEYVQHGGVLFLLSETRFCHTGPAESSKITEPLGIIINADWIESETMCNNTGLIESLSERSEWMISDMGSSITITGSTPIPVYKTPTGLNTMVIAPFGKGYVLVAGDNESFGLDYRDYYTEIIQFIRGEKK